MKKIIVYTSVLLMILVVVAEAQGFRTKRKPSEEIYFGVNHAIFKSNNVDGKARLEIYYQIFNKILNFEEMDNYFEAEYEISVDVYGDKKRKVDSYKHNQTVRVINLKKAKSKSDYRTNQVNFTLGPGKYEIVTTLYDPKHNKEIERKFKVKIKNFNSKKPAVSDIELIQAVTAKSEIESVFDKGELRLIPSVRHKYGTPGAMKLYFYMELYQGKEEWKEIKVETVLRHFTKGMLYRDSLTTEFDTPIKRQFREISMDELRPGKYELIITLRGRRDKKIMVKYQDFELIWTPKAMIKYDYKVLVNQIELIGEKEQVEKLKGKSTYEERINAFNTFWEQMDPTPGTVENETKSEFYRRIAVANENFSYIYNNGWSSDRGRIYILYGEPDQVDDYPIVPERRPYQEWHYYHGSQYRKFVFVDVNEDGDYRLIYPYDGLFQRPEF